MRERFSVVGPDKGSILEQVKEYLADHYGHRNIEVKSGPDDWDLIFYCNDCQRKLCMYWAQVSGELSIDYHLEVWDGNRKPMLQSGPMLYCSRVRMLV